MCMHMYDGVCWEMARGVGKRARDRVIVRRVPSGLAGRLRSSALRHDMAWEDYPRMLEALAGKGRNVLGWSHMPGVI